MYIIASIAYNNSLGGCILVMEFKFESKGLSVYVELDTQLTTLFDYSGTGKTYLFMLLSEYCEVEKIPFEHIDHKFRVGDKDEIVRRCTGKTVVLLDNADLYLTKELTAELCRVAEYIVVSVHDDIGKGLEGSKFKRVIYKQSSLEVV